MLLLFCKAGEQVPVSARLVFHFSNFKKMEDKPMARPGRLPDFRKMYPEASDEVIEVLKETERKM